MATPDETKPSAYDAMSSAFDELMTPAPKPEDEAPAAEAAPVEDAAAPAAEAAPAEEAPAKDEAAAPVEAGDEAELPKPDTGGEDWEARFKELEAKVTKQPELQAKPPVETPPPDIYAADEKEFLASYDKEWPDIVKGEALKRRAEYAELVKHIFTEIARVYDPLVTRGAQAAEDVAEANTLAVVRSAHADYDGAMYDDVLKWAGTLTGTRKKIVDTTIAEGDPQELVDLLTEFKSATGRKPRVVAGVAAAAPAAVTELSAKAKQAAKALGVVDSKRTAPVSGQPDINDFDAAWAEALGSK